jgi:hypothetical protein
MQAEYISKVVYIARANRSFEPTISAPILAKSLRIGARTFLYMFVMPC